MWDDKTGHNTSLYALGFRFESQNIKIANNVIRFHVCLYLEFVNSFFGPKHHDTES